ncbi:hypothetical protein LK459_03935 [Gordonia otitidis]|uniref:hypothetical protein n=1 Tax=Gordonia otitidis TaxID=249058 RepID=UPI001D1416D0|nr:hypothetical protein [Gordonia otitidis]UEA60042.1 hypothetical protein LK459_03935 [Gordonia otitidis]
MAAIDRIIRAGVIVAGIILVGGCAANSQSLDTAARGSSSHDASTTARTPSSTASETLSSSTSLDTSELPPTVPSSTHLTPVDVVCDLVANPNTNTSEPVVVIKGSVNCAEALAVARDYLAAIHRGEPEGQGLFATIRGWDCALPYVPGRSHADSYLQCTDPTGGNSVRIGN